MTFLAFSGVGREEEKRAGGKGERRREKECRRISLPYLEDEATGWYYWFSKQCVSCAVPFESFLCVRVLGLAQCAEAGFSLPKSIHRKLVTHHMAK